MERYDYEADSEADEPGIEDDDDDNKSNKSDSDRRVRGLTEESTGTDRRVYGE